MAEFFIIARSLCLQAEATVIQCTDKLGLIAVAFFLLISIPPVLGQGAGIQPESLRCEYLGNPVGIDVEQPRLSWILTSVKRNQKQTAFRILVASSPEKLDDDEGDRWDSNKVVSGEPHQIAYEGEKLASGQACFWISVNLRLSTLKLWKKSLTLSSTFLGFLA